MDRYLFGPASGCRIVATDLPGVNELLRGAQADFIDLVKTPRLQFLDHPYYEDEKGFEQNLAHALQRQLDAARKHPQIDVSSIQEKIASFTWKGIFRKIRAVYDKVIT